jgi:hypothetical protein
MLTYSKIYREFKWAISGTIFAHMRHTNKTKSKIKLLQSQIKTNKDKFHPNLLKREFSSHSSLVMIIICVIR